MILHRSDGNVSTWPKYNWMKFGWVYCSHVPPRGGGGGGGGIEGSAAKLRPHLSDVSVYMYNTMLQLTVVIPPNLFLTQSIKLAALFCPLLVRTDDSTLVNESVVTSTSVIP